LTPSTSLAANPTPRCCVSRLRRLALVSALKSLQLSLAWRAMLPETDVLGMRRRRDDDETQCLADSGNRW
ncbi:MAG: hypothetical protein ACK56I_29260, partial [bacterium]